MQVLSKFARLGCWAVFATMLGLLAGCGTFYVDAGLKDTDAAQFRKAEPPHAVQLLFEFQTKGVANARATASLKARVFEQVQKSGIFTDVTEAPVSGGALLSITVNNVPTDDEAYRKGFVTGLTLGLVGSKVSDGYICMARYSASDAAMPILKQERHAIHSTFGASGPPANAIKAASLGEAVTIMMRQIVGQVLLDVSTDPAFK